MALPFTSRVKNAWNAFFNARDPTYTNYGEVITYTRPDRIANNRGIERTIIASVFNRITNDVADVNIRHVRLDDAGRYTDEIDSHLNDCLSVEANIDQTGRAMIHDVVASLLDEGCVALVPTDTDKNPKNTDSYDILELRVAKIIEWRPTMVKVDVYNEQTGKHEEVYLDKKYVAIIENPFYSVMNEKNSTMQRLVRKLNLLDRIDDQIGSNKLDLIIQLPSTIKGELKRQQAQNRVKDIANQLEGSQYGIAYIDGVEKVTQLNRPIENTLLGQIEYLTNLALAQLGMTQAILDGTADEKTMLNYQNRVIKPILNAITEEMERKFLSKKARTQGQAIRYFSDPFSLVPVGQIAEIADKFTRNEIMTGNEIRQIVGIKPSTDPRADELRNKNLSEPAGQAAAESGVGEDDVQRMIEEMKANANGGDGV